MSCHVLGHQHEHSGGAGLAGRRIHLHRFHPARSRNQWCGKHGWFARNADFSAERAVFWASSSSPAVILSTVGEFTNAVAAGISDNGQIVGIGYNEDFSKQRPFLWPSATSQGIDLTTFFPAGSNWDLDSMFAAAINNRGEIVGSGLFTDGTVHNFVLIPVHGDPANDV